MNEKQRYHTSICNNILWYLGVQLMCIFLSWYFWNTTSGFDFGSALAWVSGFIWLPFLYIHCALETKEEIRLNLNIGDFVKLQTGQIVEITDELEATKEKNHRYVGFYKKTKFKWTDDGCNTRNNGFDIVENLGSNYMEKRNGYQDHLDVPAQAVIYNYKPEEKKMSGAKELVNEVKEILNELKPSFMTIVYLFLIDHFLLGGRLRNKLKDGIDKLLEPKSKE